MGGAGARQAGDDDRRDQLDVEDLRVPREQVDQQQPVLQQLEQLHVEVEDARAVQPVDVADGARGARRAARGSPRGPKSSRPVSARAFACRTSASSGQSAAIASMKPRISSTSGVNAARSRSSMRTGLCHGSTLYVTVGHVMKAHSGRPRDPRIDEAVLRAAAELVEEVGYADLTIAAIAERAGTTKPAIYRRWPSKAHLRARGGLPRRRADLALPDTGVAAPTTCARCCGVRRRRSPHPVARALTPGLMAEIAADPTLHAALLERFGGVVEGLPRPGRDRGRAGRGARRRRPRRAHRDDRRRRADARCSSRSTDELDDDWVDRTTDLLMRGIAA